MKLKGIKLVAPAPTPIAIQHGQETVVLLCRVLTKVDWDKHDKLNPSPEPIKLNIPGGGIKLDTDSEEYKKAVDVNIDKRLAYMVIASLDSNEDIQFETVNLDDSSTWTNYRDEMREAGFTDAMIGNLVNQCINVNTFDPKLIEAAKQSFLVTKK